MFGNDSLPSRIFSYGGNIKHVPVGNTDTNLPFPGHAEVYQAMRLAHTYHNQLVELELARRKRVDEALLKISPELVGIEKAIAEADAKYEAAEEKIRRASAIARTKVRPEDALQAIRESKAAKKDLWPRRKDLRTKLFGKYNKETKAYDVAPDPEWTPFQNEINAWANAEQKRLRAASGLYWGTYLIVEQSVKRSGPPPQFASWDGHGHLAVQIQHGLSIKEVLACTDTRVRIEPVPAEAWLPGGRHLRKTRVWFRIGSQPNGEPLWAVVPFVYHRQIPSDAQVKWVHLVRYRIGTNFDWRVQFVLSRESGWAHHDCAETGSVGIDIGWRLKPDRSLRVAYWKDLEGQHDELVIPADWLTEFERTESIRSFRDTEFDTIRDRLSAWVVANANILPDWFKEDIETLPQWKSQRRLASLVIRWRNARFEGDAEMFAACEDWRKHDKHHFNFESNLRDQLLSRRMHLYRNFAAEMRRKYHTVFIEDLDLREFHKNPKAEEPTPDGALKEHTRDACLSLLIQYLKESMAELVKRPAPDTTRRCCYCGSIEDWDRKELMHTCGRCGRNYDQDYCAAHNLLYGEPGPEAQKPPAPPDDKPKEDAA